MNLCMEPSLIMTEGVVCHGWRSGVEPFLERERQGRACSEAL
jgi:hypothetical protein